MIDERIYKKLAICQKVDNMIATDGWNDIIKPRIMAMIESFSGTSTKDGLITLGSITTALNEREMTLAVGRRMGMVEVLNMILSHPKEREHLKSVLDNNDKIEKAPMKDGMVGSKYDVT
jgi:hypothetical protein